ncbi:MAG TPA: MarR family transcriptional regulator [Blastocatellia bacterium]|jgi:DNA-binding MarR family transcriptional regulator
MGNHNHRVHTALFGLFKPIYKDVERRLASTEQGITMLQCDILRYLEEVSLTINELARRMMIKPPSLVAVVDALERAGCLQRKPDPSDRRRTPLHITPKGKAFLKNFPVCAETDVLSVALDRLGERKAEQLARLLEELATKVGEVRHQ